MADSANDRRKALPSKRIAPTEKVGGAGKSVDDVGRTMPAKYLAVGQHTIPYALRVEQIASHGLPDLIADTAEAQPPGHFGVDSPLRSEIDDMLMRAADYIQSQEAP